MLDLACGDGGLGEALLARGLRYRGVDSTPEMVDAARARLGAACAGRPRRSQRLRAPEPRRRDDGLPRDLLRARPARVLRGTSPRTRRRSSCSTSTRGSTASTDVLADLRSVGLRHGRAATVLRPADRVAARPACSRAAKALERSGPLARLALRASLHVPRRCVALARRTAAGSPPGRSPRRAGGARSCDGSTSAGTNVGATVISIRHGTFGGLSVAPFALQSGTSKRRVSVTRSIRGWLSGPIPTGPIRTVALPVVRSLGLGHQPIRVEPHDREAGLVVGHVVARVGRACDSRILARADHPAVRLASDERVLELQRAAVDPVQHRVLPLVRRPAPGA